MAAARESAARSSSRPMRSAWPRPVPGGTMRMVPAPRCRRCRYRGSVVEDGTDPVAVPAEQPWPG